VIQHRAAGLREPLLAFLAATAAAAGLFWLGQSVPIVGRNLHGAIAIVFLYVPWLAARIRGTPFDYQAAGMRLAPRRRNLWTFALTAGTTWPIFVGAFFIFYGTVCARTAPELVVAWWRMFAPVCPQWLGVSGIGIRFPPDFVWLILSQLVVVALPEELFFRGYLYQRLEALWPSRRRILGASVGPALWLSSLLFALGHVLVDLDPRRFAVFFPGMVFGWMRARTGSVASGTAYHAGCNLLSDVLHTTYFL